MKRPLKFRAYIPALQITVYEIAVYNNGDLLARSGEFDDRLTEKNDGYLIDWDDVWGGDRETRAFAVQRYNKYKNGYEEVLSFFILYGAMLLDADQCIISQYTGLNDSDGKEIYENDIIELRRDLSDIIEDKSIPPIKINLLKVYFRNQQFVYDMYNTRGCLISGCVPLRAMLELNGISSYKVVGSLPLDRSLIFNQNEK